MVDKREHILNIAEELFAEYGFEGTSVRELSKKAKVNVAMISYYFGSKEQLIKALIQARAGSFREKLESLYKEDLPPIDKVDIMVDHWVERIFSNQRFHRVLNREISLQQRSSYNKMISEIMLGNFEAAKKIIFEGQKRKMFRMVDVELTMASIIGTISKAVQSSYLSCKIIGIDPEQNSILDDTFKKRLKKHLKDMMRAHLLKSK